MAILPYMRQLPQDYYTKNLPLPVTTVPTPDTPYPPNTPLPVPGPTDPINEGGIWVGTIEPANPGEGWLFFNTNNNTLYIYVDGNWEVVPSVGVASVGTSAPASPLQGEMWLKTTDNSFHVYDGSAWQAISGGAGGIAEAPTDGGIYARQNSAWTSTYDGGAY